MKVIIVIERGGWAKELQVGGYLELYSESEASLG